MVRHIVTVIFALFITSIMLPIAVGAESPKTVLINEIQLDGTLSKYQEFIELVNVSTTPVDITGWKLTIKNFNGSECTSSKSFAITFAAATLLPEQPFLIAAQKDTTQYFSELTPDLYYLPCSGSASVLATEKVIRLFDSANVLVDDVYFSNLSSSATSNPISYDFTTQVGYSFERHLDAITGLPIDTDNSLQDFGITIIPTPGILATLPDPEEPAPDDIPPEETPPPEDEPVDEVVPPSEEPLPLVEPPILLPITINELYIDPASPETDSEDEWIELYNPNASGVDIGGYTIYSGETFSYRHTFANGTMIGANSYIVVSSGSSSLAFANGAGAAKLVTKDGETASIVTYESAPTGQAWAIDSAGVWKWTTTPTISSVNTITAPLPKVVVAAVTTAKKTTKASTASTAKATSTKVAAAKTTKAKAATEVEGAALVPAPSPLPVWLLATLGSLAVLYSAYEYRFDVANKIYQFRQHRTSRKTHWR